MTLTDILIRSMLMTKLKFASAGMLAAIALASGGIVAATQAMPLNRCHELALLQGPVVTLR